MSRAGGSGPEEPRAPLLARTLLRVCVPAERREDTAGDLNEMHARRRRRSGALAAWLATSTEAVAVAAGFLVQRWRERSLRAAWLTWPEIKLALRMARKQPLLNLAALLALATGIGLASAAFGLIEMTSLARLPFPDGDRFVLVDATDAETGAAATIHRSRFEALADEGGAFSYVGAVTDGSANILEEDGAVEAVPGAAVSAGVFRVLPYRPLLGRLLVPSDGASSAPPVVVLGEALWRRRYGADPAVLGRTIDFGGTVRQVVGVLPADAGFPNKPDIWIPLVDRAGAYEGARVTERDGGDPEAGLDLQVFGVLRRGATLPEAQDRIAALSAGWEAERPDAAHLRVRLRSFTEIPDESAFGIFLASILTAMLAVVLVIAANVGNLVAARTAARRSELAVRTALGAARGNLVMQLFAEVLLLGGAAAAMAAWGLVRLMSSMEIWLGRDVPFWLDLMPGPATWTFLVAVTVLACVVAGVVPALRATRGVPGDGLRSAGRGGAAVFGRAASVVSVLQVAFSVALLGAALLAVRGMQQYAGGRSSVAADRILVAGVSMSRAGGPDSARAALERVERVVAEVPGAGRTGFAAFIPGVEAPTAMVEVEPAPEEAAEAPRPAPVADVRPGYLEALGATATLGRLLEPDDLREGAPRVVVVNASFVRKFLHGRNPLGRRVRIATSRRAFRGQTDAPEWREIVGVVPDLGLSVGDPGMEAGFYVPLTDPAWGYLVVATTDDPGAVADRLRRVLARAEPGLLVPLVRTLDQAGSENARTLALFGGVLSALGGMALLLSLVSTYALVSFTVSRRVREVGIRVALGASRPAVLRSVAGRAAIQIAVGALAGAPLGLLLVQVKRLFVFRVPSGEPWVLPLVALAMVGAGILASWVPARRALGIGPAEALRAE